MFTKKIFVPKAHLQKRRRQKRAAVNAFTGEQASQVYLLTKKEREDGCIFCKKKTEQSKVRSDLAHPAGVEPTVIRVGVVYVIHYTTSAYGYIILSKPDYVKYILYSFSYDILSISLSSSCVKSVFCIAFTLSAICSGLDAPTSTEVTMLSLRTQESAIWASD